MMEEFSDKRVALITGASRGLGAAIALELAAQGLVVAINYLTSGSAADHLCQRIRDGGGQARAFQADVREESDVAGLCAQVLNAFGRIDILVVNATGPQPMLSIEQQTWQSYLDQLEFFVKSPLLLLKQVLPGMRTRRFGRIIQIGSEVFEIGNPCFANYVAAKARNWGLLVPGRASLLPRGSPLIWSLQDGSQPNVTQTRRAPNWMPTSTKFPRNAWVCQSISQRWSRFWPVMQQTS
jgi:3-oxoacyl-[acyl-carrier protein] reductase